MYQWLKSSPIYQCQFFNLFPLHPLYCVYLCERMNTLTWFRSQVVKEKVIPISSLINSYVVTDLVIHTTIKLPNIKDDVTFSLVISVLVEQLCGSGFDAGDLSRCLTSLASNKFVMFFLQYAYFNRINSFSKIINSSNIMATHTG